jgi:hypothetical protein
MYFHESEAIAFDHPDLHCIVEQIDGHLATIFNSAPLRTVDFSCNLACDTNQVIAIFDLLVERDVLASETTVECERCHNLMSAAAFEQAIADEDDFDCSSCSRPFRRRTPMTTVYRMTSETLARPKPAPPTADVESALRALDQSASVFRRLAQVWVLKYEREMILMEDARGLSYLARLLADPGRIVPAASLLAALAGIDPRITTGSSGHLLDDETFVKYKRRYTELEEELEEAENHNDLGRVAKLKSERDALGMELARAYGLAGRKRERTDVERVRKSVSMAVKRAIDSIRDQHAVLGRHLRNSISPGLTFSYDPERETEWLT